MIYVTAEKWNRWNLNNEKYQFFYLRLNELFSDKTFESWQVRSTNVRYLLREIHESAKIASKVKVHHTNIRDLIDELNETVKDDIIINDHLNNILFYLTKIDNEYKSILKKDTKDFSPLSELTQITISLFDGYLGVLFNEIEKILLSPETKFKIQLNKLLQLLAIEIHNLGYSPEYISNTIDFFKDATEFEIKFRKFRDSYSLNRINFECYYLVRPGYIPEVYDSNEFLTVNLDELDRTEEIEKFLEQDNNGVLLKVKIKCLDKITALIAGRRKIRNLLSLMVLYKPQNPESLIHPISLVKNECIELIESSSSVPSYIFNSHNPGNNYIELLKSLREIDESDSNYIKASIQYFKLSLLSQNDETKIINLWIALETLFQEQDGNIIQRISKYVPVIVSSNYLNNILRSLSRDLKPYWSKKEHESLSEFCMHSNKYFIHPKDLNRILLQNKENQIYIDLCNLSEDNSVLKFRIGNIKEGLYHSSKEMKNRIVRHNNNIEWQLRRIYRIRNKIMHQGSLEVDITQFYRHLYSYYVNTVHSLLHSLSKNDHWSMRTAFISFSNNYDCLMENLTKNENLNEDMIYNFDIMCQSEEKAWKDV